MTDAACILGDEALVLWGLSGRERVARQLAQLRVAIVAHPAADGDHTRVLLIDAGYLYEPRTIAWLLQHHEALLRCAADTRIAAAVVARAAAPAVAAWLAGAQASAPPALPVLEPGELERYDEHLRRTAPPLLEPITARSRARLESLLYGNAYKGITDLVTKWWWPLPARRLVALCAKAGITPNMVTWSGFALMLLACAAFYHGHYLAGLASGWLMTLLDTVDGKLARVTVQSSRLGHVLDHGMDIVHPPVWYVLWGMGLGTSTAAGYAITDVYAAIVAGYLGGRLLEALFHALGRCSLFAWRPFDAYFRLITARRNPCLIVLTAATLGGRPDLGLLSVAAWTVLSTAIMAVRVLQGAYARLRRGPLDSWLREAQARERHPAAFRTFSGTRRAYE